MSEPFEFGGPVVWQPSLDTIESANLTQFMRQHAIAGFGELMHRSTQDIP